MGEIARASRTGPSVRAISFARCLVKVLEAMAERREFIVAVKEVLLKRRLYGFGLLYERAGVWWRVLPPIWRFCGARPYRHAEQSAAVYTLLCRRKPGLKLPVKTCVLCSSLDLWTTCYGRTEGVDWASTYKRVEREVF